MLFGFSIGINVSFWKIPCDLFSSSAPLQVTFAVFIGTPPPVGYGFGQFAIAGAYGSVL